MSIVQMGRKKLRDPRGLFRPLIGPRWFVRLGVGTSTSVWLVGSAGFKGNLAKLWLTFPTSRGTKWVKTGHQCCGVGKVDFSRVVLWVAL